MSSGWLGRPPSRKATEWVKLSWFVQVTVAPVATAMSAGANRYDGGRSTVVGAPGGGGDPELALDEHPPRASMPSAPTTRATIGPARRVVIARGARRCGRGPWTTRR